MNDVWMQYMAEDSGGFVRLGKINPYLLLEMKNITLQLFVQNDCTPLGIFDFCLGIKVFKGSRLSVVLFIGAFDSYVP